MLRNIYNTAASCAFFNPPHQKSSLIAIATTSFLGAWEGYTFASANGYSLPAFTVVYAVLGGVSGAAGCHFTRIDIHSLMNKEITLCKSIFKNFALPSIIGFTMGAFAGLGVSLEIADKYNFTIANILAYSAVHGMHGACMGLSNGMIGVVAGCIPSTLPHKDALNNNESTTLKM